MQSSLSASFHSKLSDFQFPHKKYCLYKTNIVLYIQTSSHKYFLFREIEDGESAMKFFCSVIVSFCRLSFFSKRAEVFLPAVFFDVGDPFSASAVPGDSFVFRRGSPGGTAVDIVLPDGAVAKVGFAIVQAVVIDMVADQMRRRIGNQSVHEDSFGFVGNGNGPHGVDGFQIALAVPSKLRKPDIIFQVNFSVSALG